VKRIWINLRTEFTFKQCYGHLDEVAKKCATLGSYGGIADNGNTFGHIRWMKACKKAGIKPIYGVRLPVVDELQKGVRRYPYNWMTFIAKTTKGLQEIYELVDLAHQQFYYRPRITYAQVNGLSEDVVIFGGVAPRWDLLKPKSCLWRELSPCIPYSQRDVVHPIASIDNFYPNIEDVDIYEPFADERLREQKTSPIHILTREEWLNEFPGKEYALENLEGVAESCNVELPKAHMVKYIGKDNIEKWCKEGAEAKGLLTKPEYIARYKREMELIKEKGYIDYFLVVADVIRYAKTKMAVGPARGSSAGSLVCYLMGITEIDPLEYDLYFERFIDVNRFDLPDIDVDFQDNKRYLVIKYLERKYGRDNVAQIANISRMKPKSAITRFAQALGVPIDDVQELKDAIMDRSGGDARANDCMEDTFNDTDVGQKFLEKHPCMEVVKSIEAHASHTGVHAAGILVCNEPITNYCGVNSRDNKRIGMLDKKDAEKIDLLKIDSLGLRTLAIIADICDQIGKHYTWIYEIPVDDPKAYEVFNAHRFNGIFQFEGIAVQGLAKQMPIENMEDIAALGALGRPGPLVSGGATSYIQFRTGQKEVKYVNDHPVVVEATKSTFGVIVYQEQVMKIVRELGQLSWEKTSAIRKAMSKTLGVEFFDKMYAEFEVGAVDNGITKEEAEEIWKHINTMGSWSFNKSHAVSYGLISYLCAYFKAHYPMEFVVACLNHSNSDRSALKILRDAVENEGIEYNFFHPDHSMESWSVKDNILYGGFMTLHGFAITKAKKAVTLRAGGYPYPKGMQKNIKALNSPFKYLYPAKELYGDFYTDPKSHGLNSVVTLINKIQGDGDFTIIGCLVKKNLRDANEACFVSKRKGKFATGATAWLNLTLEDDTGSIMCKIKIQDYERFGKIIAETGKEEKDWYMVYGKRINGWGLIFVENIKRITRRI